MKRTPITTSRRPHKMIDRTTPPGYRYHALYKTSAGIGTPNCKKATPDAASVFFVVRYTRHSMAWCTLFNVDSAAAITHNGVHHAAHNGTICGCCVRLRPAIDAQNRISRRPIMVTLAGQPQGWPVSFLPGSSNPVNVTAPIEIGTSGGDSLTSKKEAA